MATRASIEFDFNKAKMQADKLDELARNLKYVAENDFSSAMQDVSMNWKGEHSVTYTRKGADLQNRMTKTSQELSQIADDIRKAAKRMYDAELNAIRIAEERK